MTRLRYWYFCLRFGGTHLTYEQFAILDFTGRAYNKTIGKALKKL